MPIKSVKKEDILTFTYDGRDDMIDVCAKKIPKCHSDFKCTLKLKDGREIDAPPSWRNKIWNWWYISRRDEILKYQDSCLIDVAKDMLSINFPHGKYTGPMGGDRR